MMEDLDNCMICNINNTIIDKKAGRYLNLPQSIKVIKCKRCGLRWLSPIKSTKEYQEMYKSLYFEDIPEDYKKVVSGRIVHYRNRIRRIRKYMGRSGFRLLDIGAASGEFVNEACIAGIDAVGIEPSYTACRQSRKKHDIEMIQADFLDIDLGKNIYDVVHMNHVFEHLSTPLKGLEKLREVLREDGVLVIEVPNQFDDILHLIMSRPQSFTIYSIHHPFFYNPRSITLLLAQYGFKILELSTWKPIIIARANFYPGDSFIGRYLLSIAELVFRGRGPLIEVYARKMKEMPI